MILFSAKISEKHQTRLKEEFTEQQFIMCSSMDEASAYLKAAEILVTYGEDLTPELIEHAAQLKWIMVLSAGMDRMPFDAIKAKGILVTNARGIHKTPMAEYAISMLLQVYRQANMLMEKEKAHEWDRNVRMEELNGKTVLVAGAGAIGQEVARLAKAFQMKTIGLSRSGEQREHFDENYQSTELESLLPETDIVVSVLPSTKETKEFYTYEHFKKLPKHAVFLNMGRGDAVKTEVILDAIRNKEIAHAVLDVFEEEPLPNDHPFWDEENITVTPHLSGISKLYQTRALDIFEENLKIYLQGKDDFVNKIDVSRGY
ncbi:D-2-hydroxyacid dehydrogenase [Virgibacillus halodenitrificans]|uniref:D-2-hydroxyacid dehydrogenase n=1 Tax=Virgibacillus halodenitrificans TaxID=1482 RepID=UPI00045C81C6|nr:D-2-hydroxyacid dehydrogenase [Virgibacillus halodenitrificans]CDQ36685.1 Glyoxylate/hydroxypyruvate reductase B [Virgibacillus halodenitrificans]